MNPVLIYLLAINVLSVVVCCYDKFVARKGKRRVSEKALLLMSAFGGSIMMYFTMCIIRHKTRHNKFMVGLLLIMLIQVMILFFINYNNF